MGTDDLERPTTNNISKPATEPTATTLDVRGYVGTSKRGHSVVRLQNVSMTQLLYALERGCGALRDQQSGDDFAQNTLFHLVEELKRGMR